MQLFVADPTGHVFITKTAIDALLARHGVTMSATFVPQSASRHSQEKTRSLNWRIAFMRASNGASFAIDYSQGIGHAPAHLFGVNPPRSGTIGREAIEIGISETGAGKKPAAADLLHCILLDSDAQDYTYEEWCSNLGFDTDSRKAQAIYDACRAQTRDAQRVLGRELMDEASKLLEDY